jgi:hypothetical protein
MPSFIKIGTGIQKLKRGGFTDTQHRDYIGLLYESTVKTPLWSELSHDIGRSRDSSVDIATGCGLDDEGIGVRFPVGSRIFSSPRLGRLWDPPNFLSMDIGGKAARA